MDDFPDLTLIDRVWKRERNLGHFRLLENKADQFLRPPSRDCITNYSQGKN